LGFWALVVVVADVRKWWQLQSGRAAPSSVEKKELSEGEQEGRGKAESVALRFGERGGGREGGLASLEGRELTSGRTGIYGVRLEDGAVEE
jgi:hypothetical protein